MAKLRFKRGNKFNGADDIYLTKKSIAVKRYSCWYDMNGKFHSEESVKYYPKTKKNLTQAKQIWGWVRNGRG